MANPHWEVLQAVKARLELATAELPAIADLPAVQVRELPYVLAAGVDVPPLLFVCPPDGRGERAVRNQFGGVTQWAYPVAVLLVFATNRSLASGLEGRLQLRHDVGERLFSTSLPGMPTAYDCDPDPRSAADVQGALGTNYVVSGYEFSYRLARQRV